MEKFDKNGLMYTKYIEVLDDRFFCENQEVYISPMCGSVVDYLLANLELWQVARVKILHSKIMQKRAPIIGVPFGVALKNAMSASLGLQKSMYQINDWTKYKGHAVIATMTVHTVSTLSCIEFQAWQLLDVSPETFYIHAKINKSSLLVEHLDGATIQHTELEHREIRNNANKVKGTEYTKHFRLDGNLPINTVVDLMNLYFPIQDLTNEFVAS